MRPRRHPGLAVLYVVAGILVTLAAFLGFTSIWAHKTFPNVKVDEILYQLNAPMEGTGGGIMEGFVHACIVPTIIVAVLCVIACYVVAHRVRRRTWVPWRKRPPRPVGRHSASRDSARQAHKDLVFSRRTAIALGATAAASTAISLSTLRKAWIDFGAADYFADVENDFVREHYVDPAQTPIMFPALKRNLIFIYLESMETTFADIADGGAFEYNCIPELTELAKMNEDFGGTNPELDGGISYAGTTWTMGAMFATTSGLPLQIDIHDPENGMSTQSAFFPGITTLGDLLEEQGYEQVLLLGSDAKFGGRKLYFTDHGDYEMRDYYWAIDNGLIPPDYKVWWGYEDSKLFEYAKETLTELGERQAPFNFTMLTADTHFEDGYKCEHCPDTYDARYANIMACSSKQVASFVSWCSQQPWFENTTIVISGDHPTMDADFCEDVPADFRRRVYTCYINSAVSPVNPADRREYSTFDELPTTLAALGVAIVGDRLGLGTNLFSETPTLTEELGDETVRSGLSHASPFVHSLAALDYEAGGGVGNASTVLENDVSGVQYTQEDAVAASQDISQLISGGSGAAPAEAGTASPGTPMTASPAEPAPAPEAAEPVPVEPEPVEPTEPAPIDPALIDVE